jgi:hypothetical protein
LGYEIKRLETTGESFKEADDKMDDEVSKYKEEVYKSRICYMSEGIHHVRSLVKYKG